MSDTDTPTKEDIKSWMSDTGYSRERLAQKCHVKKRTVDAWLSSSTPIPPSKMEIIKQEMDAGNQGTNDEIVELMGVHGLSILMSGEQREIIEQAAKGEGMTISQYMLEAVLLKARGKLIPKE